VNYSKSHYVDVFVTPVKKVVLFEGRTSLREDVQERVNSRTGITHVQHQVYKLL